MADITMCEGRSETLTTNGTIVRICAKRHQCYRHTAPQNENRQSWFTVAPLHFVNGEQICEYFSSNEGY